MLMYCVRHGESAFNAEGRVQGQANVPLSELGRRQSHAVAEALRPLPIEAVFSSPLARAYETAAPIAEALSLPIETDDRLMELNAGVFQGLVHAEMQDRFPEEYRCWKSGDPDYRIPQGETRRELMQRAREVLEVIARRPLRQVVVVAHGGVLTAAFKALLDIPPRRNPFMLYNASISQLEFSDPLKLLTLNQVEHLRAADGRIESRTGDL